MATVTAAQLNEPVGLKAPREQGGELVLYEQRQVGPCNRLRLGNEGRGVRL